MCWTLLIGLRNSIISLKTYCILTQRHTCVAQAQDISTVPNELSGAVEEGAEFTLTRINMFGNSNSLHLTSLCEKKSGETFDNDIFHMIRARWKSAFERQWSPGKLFVDHTTTIVVRLSVCVAWGIPLGSRLIVHFHGTEREEGDKGDGAIRTTRLLGNRLSFWYHLWAFKY